MTQAAGVPLEEVACPQCGASEAAPLASGRDWEYATTPQTFRFVRCAACALAYLSPRPAAAALATLYPPDYYSFTGEEVGRGAVRALRARWDARKARACTHHLGPGRRRILDVGCGRGRFLAALRRAAGAEAVLCGIDLDPDAVAEARRQGFEATRTTLADYAPAQRFDLIVLQQILEHVADPRADLAKLRDLLAPGGTLVLETPNLAGWDYRLFRGGLWGGYHFPRHFTLFTRASLRRMVESVGLQVVEQRSLASLSFWSWSIHHWLGARGLPDRLVRWSRPPNAVLLALTAPLEILQLGLGRETSNQRLVARRREGAGAVDWELRA